MFCERFLFCNLSSHVTTDKINNVFECRYGLLGPSGCGKTTLLRCLVGRLEINHGKIIVLGKRPSSEGHEVPGRIVGYMPQETALYKDFTISEMLHHFGRLHNMNRKDIVSREESLSSFLDLPTRTKKVSQLRFIYEIYFNLKKNFCI